MIDAVPVRDASAGPADASLAELTARRRGRLRRYLLANPRVMDVLVVLCYLVLVTPTAVESVIHGDWPVAVLLAAAAPVLLFRRAYPVRVAAAVGALELAVTFLHPWGSNVSAGLWFSLYAVAVVRTRRFALAALALTTAPLLLLYFLLAVGPLDGRLPDMAVRTPENFQLLTGIAAGIGIALSNVIATGIGISVRQRREHEHEIAAWAARAQQLGSVTERNRIAREMHDVVAHSLTVMISLSDGAAVVVKKDPERAAGVLAELSRTGRTALADMRRVLGVLREDAATGHAPREPLVAGGSLAKLLEGFRTAGLPLHYTHTGPSLPDDAAFQLTVYRIVQESLTNVLRYGRALSRVEVSIVRNGSRVTIEVLDDGRGTVDPAAPGTGAQAKPDALDSFGTGHGIAGMRERARIYAGTVYAGRAGDRGWRVHAELNCNGENATEYKGEQCPTTGPVRVLLVDDQPLLRMGFRLILEGEDDLCIVGEASNGAEAVRHVRELAPDVVLMDVRMPVLDGIEATRAIAASGSDAKIIILTTFDLDEYAFASAAGRGLGVPAQGRGAGGTDQRGAGGGQRRRRRGPARYAAAAGDLCPRCRAAWILPGQTAPAAGTPGRTSGGQQAGSPARPARDPLLEDLTPRENEMLGAMAEGLSNAEIAHRYFLSEATVKTHVRRILTKLHLRDRVQAVVYAYETGLVVPSNADY